MVLRGHETRDIVHGAGIRLLGKGVVGRPGKGRWIAVNQVGGDRRVLKAVALGQRLVILRVRRDRHRRDRRLWVGRHGERGRGQVRAVNAGLVGARVPPVAVERGERAVVRLARGQRNAAIRVEVLGAHSLGLRVVASKEEALARRRRRRDGRELLADKSLRHASVSIARVVEREIDGRERAERGVPVVDAQVARPRTTVLVVVELVRRHGQPKLLGRERGAVAGVLDARGGHLLSVVVAVGDRRLAIVDNGRERVLGSGC